MSTAACCVPAGSSPFFTKVRQALAGINYLNIVSIIVFLLIWHLASVYKLLGTFLPTPLEVLKALWVMMNSTLAGKTFFEHLWASLQRVLIGWSLAVVVAVPLGVFMALNDYVRAIVKPIFDLFKPMPPISWISLAILWFGMGEESKVFIIAIGSFVPCILNAYNGIRLVDPALYDAARMLGANKFQEITEVAMFGSLPAIFAGLQISLSIAWSCVLAAELVGSRSGMGYIIILGMNQLKPAMIIAGMIAIAITAWFISIFMSKLEKIICPWRREIHA